MNNPWLTWLEEHSQKSDPDPKPEDAPPEYSSKTIGDYRKMLDGLADAVFLPGSYDKRFARNMQALDDSVHPTVKQARLIEVMYHRYRRQIPGHDKLCVICKEKGSHE